MTFILDWLADYGFLLAGGLMILSCICFIIMVIMVIKWHNEYVDSDYYEIDDEEAEAIRRRHNNENLALLGMVAVIACI